MSALQKLKAYFGMVPAEDMDEFDGEYDDDGYRRYHDSYFDVFPGVWRHGDWITVHSDRSISISGRSDSTLNRMGVRMGSAEIS